MNVLGVLNYFMARFNIYPHDRTHFWYYLLNKEIIDPRVEPPNYNYCAKWTWYEAVPK